MFRVLYRPDVYFFVASFLRHLATILSSGDEWNVQDYILCRLGGGYVGGYVGGYIRGQ